MEVALGTRVQDMQMQPEGISRRLDVSCIRAGKSWVGRVDEECKITRRWD
jgi:hypothetical protein